MYLVDVMFGLWSLGYRKMVLVNNHAQHWLISSAIDRFALQLRSTDIGGLNQATTFGASYTHSVGNNFSAGISAQRSWSGGQTQDQVRASLTWRF